MKAVVQERYGEAQDVLRFRDVGEPEVGDDEVLVSVRAAGVGIGDWLVARGWPLIARPQYGLFKPRNRIAGHEAAGVVEVTGRSVTSLRPGDEVFGYCSGAFAEQVAVSEDSVALKPPSIDFEQAAAVTVSGLAALQALDKGDLEAGQRVLIVGASGGVGTFAVQIARSLGATVVAVCGTANVDMVRSLGAHEVIDYNKQEVTDAAGACDLIVDLAGNRPLSVLRSALTDRGTLVIVGGSGGRWLMGSGRTARALVVSRFVGQRLRALISSADRNDLARLGELLGDGSVRAVIDRTFPLSATGDAVAFVGQRHTRGKTVITV